MRDDIRAVDEGIIALVARRMEIAREIGRTKRRDDMDIRDAAQEERVVNKITELAERLHVPEDTAGTISRALIQGAVSVQEDDEGDALAGTDAIVVGSGKMGAWMSRFMRNRGASVAVYDPRGKLAGYENLEGLDGLAPTADIVIVASPLGTSKKDLESVLSARPTGVVLDLCSVKSHLVDALVDAVRNGFKVTSVHPMFGPSSPTPRGENVLVCSCGSHEADSVARGLFENAGARVLDVSLERHDSLIANVLGVPHITALLFGRSIMKSGSAYEDLSGVQGPSFRRLSSLARGTSSESRRVYHDIQRLNPKTPEAIGRMVTALEDLRKAALADDPSEFGRMMDEQRRYFGGGSR